MYLNRCYDATVEKNGTRERWYEHSIGTDRFVVVIEDASIDGGTDRYYTMAWHVGPYTHMPADIVIDFDPEDPPQEFDDLFSALSIAKKEIKRFLQNQESP